MADIADLARRISALERQYGSLVARSEQVLHHIKEEEEEDGTVLVTVGTGQLSVDHVKEFMEAFCQSHLYTMAGRSVVYMSLWNDADDLPNTCDIKIPRELKDHEQAIVCSMRERGLSAKFDKLSRMTGTAILYKCYYRQEMPHSLGMRLQAYDCDVDGATVPNSRKHTVLVAWPGQGNRA